MVSTWNNTKGNETMKPYRATLLALLLIAICTLTGCGGGGGGGTQPAATTATLKLSTTGTPSANLAGAGITITLPDGVTPALNGDGSLAGSVAIVSGVAAPGTVIAPAYTPATATAKGTLHYALASEISAGFGEGEFSTVTLAVAAGKTPGQADFALSDFTPIDVHGGTATGLGVTFTVENK